jgi:hypothetical protein
MLTDDASARHRGQRAPHVQQFVRLRGVREGRVAGANTTGGERQGGQQCCNETSANQGVLLSAAGLALAALLFAAFSPVQQMGGNYRPNRLGVSTDC